ncbi:hypothetical protein GGS21DRAFT_105075 [Xylaria nigripes]|nr:hypothetical protein GGS21DRAFT_105075 [Xylaria nigripes]
MADQDRTLSNTLANARIASPAPFPADNLQAPNRQPKFSEEWDASVRGSSIVDGQPAATTSQHPYHNNNNYQQQQQQQRQRSQSPPTQRATSILSRSDIVTADNASAHSISLSRANTLKKKSSLRRSGSLKRSSSRRSMRAGSVRSLALRSAHEPDEQQSPFYCPVPTSGSPTEVLVQRFQAWRKVLKDLITYFREIQNYYDHRSKSLVKLANVCNNICTPASFLPSGGLDDALQIFRAYHKTALVESNKAREIKEDVILALTGLRSDLNQKIKEIKNLSGDFKNSVEKEMEGTKSAVKTLQKTLGESELDPSTTTGKQDPYILRLAVDRQIERQLDEENYLHQAYLNLEASGRELESIVVGEIQKSYNAYAGIIKREADAGYSTIDHLRSGPIAMPKDAEWVHFIQKDPQFMDSEVPIRTPEHMRYPGQDHFACQEIRAGLLERKTKYLKSYTAGWYVLSPTHLHEFKSADKTGAPVMSLYLPEQKLGSHSMRGGSSNKFLLKGRQTGAVHRGHTWVFRAESHDTMMAWYEDIKTLTEKSAEELSNFVRGQHSRAYSRASQRSASSDGMVDDEDEAPFSADPAVSAQSARHDSLQNKQHTGGRFPSDLQVNAARGLSTPAPGLVENERGLRGTAVNGTDPDHDVTVATGAPPPVGVGDNHPIAPYPHLVGQSYGNTSSVKMDQAPSHAALLDHAAREDGVNPYNGEPIGPQRFNPARSFNSPVVVAGPVPTGGSRTSVITTTSLSDDSGLPSSSDAQHALLVDGYIVPKDEILQVNIANAGLKQTPRVVNSGNAGMQSNQTRSGSQRNNSVPYVPGEYPRTTPLGTPPVR